MNKWILRLLLLVIAACGGAVCVYRSLRYETIERTEVKPSPDNEDLLVDDRLEDKQPSPFDGALVDSRPIGYAKEWLINHSAAVFRLDVPMLRPDCEGNLLVIHSSYGAAAAAAAAGKAGHVLPSVNLIDGKAKQFDDGLVAALDLAYYRGLKDKLVSHVDLVRRIYDKVGKNSVAAPYLAAGLELADVRVEPGDVSQKEQYLRKFRDNEVASKPIGFYTWNPELADCFRFLRFFQSEFSPENARVLLSIAQALGPDPTLLTDYRKAVAFYSRLTNPSLCLSAADLPAGAAGLTSAEFVQLCEARRVWHKSVALFPPSTSRETVLFEKLFPLGLPPNANLMRELIRRIRSGEVDLKPRPDSGWYDHQCYALETLLLPEKGEERNKLLLTKAYKKRMVEAFQALITQRRETHVRQLGVAYKSRPPPEIAPRLRVEPCPSYYLRTARAYAFLAHFLEATLGQESLRALHGVKKDGPRTPDLFTELAWMRDLFFGLYLVSAEDIGLKPSLDEDELVDLDRCRQLALDWLAKVFEDGDLAVDTRVSVPVYVDPIRQITRLWMTFGVRLAKLEVSYARPPRLKLSKGGTRDEPWQEAEGHLLAKAHYLIPVDEFSEVEMRGNRVLTREELRAICDREKTREAIVRALR